MKSWHSRARALRSTLLSIPLAFALSACMATPPAILNAQPCFTQMVEASGLAKPTPHAALPANSAGAWVDYGNREAGQLDTANAEKAGVVGIGQACDAREAEAKRKLERKPWWRLF